MKGDAIRIGLEEIRRNDRAQHQMDDSQMERMWRRSVELVYSRENNKKTVQEVREMMEAEFGKAFVQEFVSSLNAWLRRQSA